MASSAGSDIFALTSLLIIALVVLLLLRHYLPLRSAPAFLTVPVFLSIALPSTAILLLPIDLAASARDDDIASKGIWLPGRVVLVSWRIIYWLTFVLTWVVLPILGEYMDSGSKDPKNRIIYSLRSNARYQLIMLVCAIAGLIYMIFSYGFNFKVIKGLVMALAYVWGLILAIYLMGHGLVAVPRNLFRNSNISGRLKRIQGRAPRVHEKLEDAVITLEDIEGQIAQLKQRKNGTAKDFQDWIDELSDTIGTAPPRLTLATPEIESTKIPAVITERYLADITRRCARARHQRARYVEEWDHLVQTAADLQAILDSKASQKLTFGSPSPSSSLLGRTTILTPYLRYHLHVHVLPASRIALGGLFALASIAVIWSEIIRFPAPQLSAVSLTVIHHPSQKDYQIGFGGQIIAALWICYMCACAFSSITDVPVWNQRALVRRNTYPESACWYASQIARLTVPLAYNFLTFLPEHIHKQTTFYNFLGHLIVLTPLGKWFDYLFPMFVLLPVCATFFNLYGKIKNILGFGILEDDDEENNPSGFGTGGWREGRDLIARDLNGPHGSSTLGLTGSPRPSTDASRPPRWTSPAGRSGQTTRNDEGARQPRGPPPLDPEPEEENFFALFGRRVKNTFENIETPRWMQPDQVQGTGSSPSAAGFKRPRWMGGEDSDSPNFVDRLFGNGDNSNTQTNTIATSGRSIGSGRILL